MKRKSQISNFKSEISNLKSQFPSGLTLFEVLISLAIFVGAMAAIGQLVFSGTRGSVRARLQTQAVLRCETKLAEIVAGAAPLQQGAGAFPDDSSWSWSVSFGQAPQANLYLVEVTTAHSGSNNMGRVSCTLRRLVRDPQAEIALKEQAAEALAQSQQSSSSSSSNSSSSSSGGGSSGSGGSSSGGR